MAVTLEKSWKLGAYSYLGGQTEHEFLRSASNDQLDREVIRTQRYLRSLQTEPDSFPMSIQMEKAWLRRLVEEALQREVFNSVGLPGLRHAFPSQASYQESAA